MIKTFFEKLYVLDIEKLDEAHKNKLLMCGSKNWEHYFVDDDKKASLDTLTDVVMIEFENRQEFEKFEEILDCIDYSLEHKKPMVLSYA